MVVYPDPLLIGRFDKMDYSDVINNNKANNSEISWWPSFAFHFTDVNNAVSILNTGFLYSRIDAKRQGLMENDNASSQVISITSEGVSSKVRFYFRPKTPTQYFNEGYKHKSIRYASDENANIPVPIFLLFRLGDVLKQSGVVFSESSQAGHGATQLSGIDSFAKMDFEKIYDNDFRNFKETKEYRQAEILAPNPFKIDSSLHAILCRNEIERLTLINLLREKNRSALKRYNKLIKVHNQDLFENNGLYVSRCDFSSGNVMISFSDSAAKKKYTEWRMKEYNLKSLTPVDMDIRLYWMTIEHNVLYQSFFNVQLNYENPRPIILKDLPQFRSANYLSVEVRFDDKLMSYTNHSLARDELL